MKSVRFFKQRGQSNVETVLPQVQMWLNDATNGEYTIRFERAKKPRSNDQNRLMWLWFTCIARSWSEATGRTFSPQTVHDTYCTLFLPIDTPRGRIAGHISGLTTEQMTEFLNRVQADAASEYGITLPNPEDLYFEMWAEQYSMHNA